MWRIPTALDDRDDSFDIDVLDEIKQQLPTYSTRAMRKIFIEQYSKKISAKRAILRDMYRFLTQDSAAAETTKQNEVDKRFSEFVLASDDAELIYDLRANNGRPTNVKLDPFWAALEQHLESTCVVHERRHGQHMYMPCAISMADLRDQVAESLPEGTPIPSLSWMRMNVWPSDPHT